MARKATAPAALLGEVLDDDAPPSPAELEAAAIAQQLQDIGLSPDSGDEYLGPPPELMQREEAYISVFRIERDTKRRVYCCQYAPAEFNLERLRRDKGGGYYWVRLVARNPNNKGRPSTFWQDFIELEGPPVTSAPASLNAPASVSHDQNNSTAQLATLLMQGFERMAQAIVDSRPAPTPAPTRREIIEEMQLLFSMLPKPATQPNPLGIIKDVFEVVKSMTPADPDTSPAGMLMNAAERILPMIGDVIAKTPAAQPRAAAPAGAQLAAPAPAQPAQPASDAAVNADALRFKMGLRFLCDAAAADENPELYAELVLSKVPEDQLRQFIERPDWLEFLVSHQPAVRDHAEWFGELRDSIMSPPEDETLTPAEPESRSAGNQSTG